MRAWLSGVILAGAAVALAACGSSVPPVQPVTSGTPPLTTAPTTGPIFSTAPPRTSAPSTPKPATSSGGGQVTAPHIVCSSGQVKQTYDGAAKPSPLCLTRSGSAVLTVNTPAGKNWGAADATGSGAVTVQGVLITSSGLTVTISPGGTGTGTVSVVLGGAPVWTLTVTVTS